MYTLGERIRQARKGAGLTQDKLGKAIGRSEGQISKYESDENDPPRSVITGIAHLTGVPEVWLLTGDGDNLIPLVGHIRMGGQAIAAPESNLKVPGPDGMSPQGLIAYIIDDDCMVPAYRKGDVIYVKDEVISPPDLSGEDCICLLEDGRRMLRRLMPGDQSGSFNLEAYSAQPMRSVALVGVQPIVGLRRRVAERFASLPPGKS